MASGLVINVEVGEDKHTEVLTQKRIRIGTRPDCELRLYESVLPSTSSILLELARGDDGYRVTNFDESLDLRLNGRTLDADAVIGDADEINVPPALLTLRFFPVRELPATVNNGSNGRVAQFAETAALESAATARRDDAKVFLREFTRELIREISPWTKLAVLLILSVLVGGMLYLGFGVYHEFRRTRGLNDEQTEQISRLRDLIERTNIQISGIDEKNQGIINSLSPATKVWNDYSKGVCLIAGSYIYVEATAVNGAARPLRYPAGKPVEEPSLSASPLPEASEPPPLLTPEGNGEIAEFYFVGTGFHAGDGYVLTNRHVVQAWAADERSEMLSASVPGRPRLTKLLAYFPGRRQPVALKLKLASQTDDLAVCTMEAKEAASGIPALPLDRDADATMVGKTVVMMGYPSGPDRMLALLSEAESRTVQQRYQTLEALLNYLAERTLIKPLTTQGNITDLDVRRIVYDARTAEGGSGAPVFGQSGRVIGVNFGVFPENNAVNLAVPVRYALALLQRAGWQPKESPADNNNSNTAQDPRSTSATATVHQDR